MIAFYIHPGHQLLDLAGPLDAFRAANAVGGRLLYDMHVLSARGGRVVGNAGVHIDTCPPNGAAPHTLVVAGGDVELMRQPGEVAAVRQLAGAADRVAGVCTGAFLLAETGLLDGRRATTHWSCSRDLQRRFPTVIVEPDRIFVADGRVWTSAGITAGIDLALALIEADGGVDLSRAVARELVVYHRRPGGQSQFSGLSLLDPASDRMRLALAYAREHLAEPLPIERLAEAARLSLRQFGRAFRAETGETPAKAVERLRVEAARLRIEEGSEPVEVIARAVGFVDPERMRRAFVKRLGYPPQALRRISAPLRRTNAIGLGEAPPAEKILLHRTDNRN